MFDTLLIADRGEPAARIARACRALGIRTVAVHSTQDRDADHVRLADEAVCIGPAAAERSYANAAALISAAHVTRAQAIHPGQGVLATSPEFAEAVETSGFRFVGAAPSLLRLIADRERLRDFMRESGLPGVPHGGRRVPSTPEDVASLAREVGFPLIAKTGDDDDRCRVRIVQGPAELLPALNQLEAERRRDASIPPIRLERYLAGSRHVEVQLVGDGLGHCLRLGTRDGSIRHERRQLLAEAPAAGIPHAIIETTSRRCAEAVKLLGIRGLVTVRLLYRDGNMNFLSITPRLDPAIAATEVTCDSDLVGLQIRVAAGDCLPCAADEAPCEGHAILCHIRAEHPFRFSRSTGRIAAWTMPGGPGIRVDSHCEAGTRIGSEDPDLLANVVAHGPNRVDAISRMRGALAETTIDGLRSNVALHQGIMDDEGFRRSDVHIGYIDQEIARRYRPRRRLRAS